MLGFGKITGYLTTVLQEDNTSRTVPLTGTMSLIPQVRQNLVLINDDGHTQTVLPTPIYVAVNDGWIEDDQHNRWVEVVATNLPDMSPPEFFYRAVFDLRFEKRRVRFGPFTVFIPVGETLDISELTPIPNSTNLYTPGMLNPMRGRAGMSAYELAVEQGYQGSLHQWLIEKHNPNLLILHEGEQPPPGLDNVVVAWIPAQ